MPIHRLRRYENTTQVRTADHARRDSLGAHCRYTSHQPAVDWSTRSARPIFFNVLQFAMIYLGIKALEREKGDDLRFKEGLKTGVGISFVYGSQLVVFRRRARGGRHEVAGE